MDVKQSASQKKGGTILADLIEIFGRGADKLVSTATGAVNEHDEAAKLEIAVQKALARDPELKQLAAQLNFRHSNPFDRNDSLREICKEISGDKEDAPKVLRLADGKFVTENVFYAVLTEAGVLDGTEANRDMWHRIFYRLYCYGCGAPLKIALNSNLYSLP